MSEPVESLDALVEENGEARQEPSVGERLRQAREAHGLQTSDVAQTLKLGLRQVEALESGDWSVLPGNTFIRGFVRNYARLVQLDAGPLMAELDRILDKPVVNLVLQTNGKAAMPMGSASDDSGRDRQVVIGGLILVLLATAAYFLIPGDLSALRDSAQGLLDSAARKEAAEPATRPVAAGEPLFPPGQTQQQVMHPQAAGGEAPSAGLPVASSPVPVAGGAPGQPEATRAAVANEAAAGAKPQLRVVAEKESWIEVRDHDDKVIFSQLLGSGSEQAVAGQGPLSVTVGYAPGVRLFWRGKAVDLAASTKGDVARLNLE